MAKRSNKSKKESQGEPPHFYVPGILECCALSEEESHHAINVLRLSEGDIIRITDGQGHLYEGVIASAHRKCTQLASLQERSPKAPSAPPLHIGIAPTKSMDRLEWVLEKLTEVGLASFHIVITEHTIRRKVSLDRLEKIMVSAMKQSRKVHATELHLHASFDRLLQSPLPQFRYIAYCESEESKADLRDIMTPGEESFYLIGPEGDFSAEEVASAVAHGFKPVALGDERLRTETAALYAGLLHHILNR